MTKEKDEKVAGKKEEAISALGMMRERTEAENNLG